MKPYQNKDLLYQKYIVENMSVQQTAQVMSCCPKIIRWYLKKNNILKKSRSEEIQINKSKLAAYYNKSFLYQKYITEKKNMYQIAKELNCSYSTIWLYLKKFNINIKPAKKGTKSRAWKGGKHTNNCRYILINYPNHPCINSNYILEHRLIMENHLRKTNPSHPALIEINGKLYLKREYIVHHKNQKREDNRIENLELWYKGHPTGHKVCICCGGLNA